MTAAAASSAAAAATAAELHIADAVDASLPTRLVGDDVPDDAAADAAA